METTEIKGEIKTLTEKVAGLDKRMEKVEDSYAILVKDIADLKGFKFLIILMVVTFLSSLNSVQLKTTRVTGNCSLAPIREIPHCRDANSPPPRCPGGD